MCWLSLHKFRWFTTAKLILKCSSDHGISTLKNIKYFPLMFTKSNTANWSSHLRHPQYSHDFPFQPRQLSCLQPAKLNHLLLLEITKCFLNLMHLFILYSRHGKPPSHVCTMKSSPSQMPPLPEKLFQIPQHNDCALF